MLSTKKRNYFNYISRFLYTTLFCLDSYAIGQLAVASNICAHPGRYFVTAPARQLLPIAAPPMPAFIPPALPAALVPPSCVPVIQPSAAAMPAVAVTRTPLLPMPLLNAPYTAAALPAPPVSKRNKRTSHDYSDSPSNCSCCSTCIACFTNRSNNPVLSITMQK
ncbi:hypothetical protein ACQ4LE_004677 [Meloidogyne hapla]